MRSLLALLAVLGVGAHPVKTTVVTVREYEYGFKLSRTVVPAGRVTFLMENVGTLIHDFHVVGLRAGPFLQPGQSGRMTVRLKRGRYLYLCDVKYHAPQGMQGFLRVR